MTKSKPHKKAAQPSTGRGRGRRARKADPQHARAQKTGDGDGPGYWIHGRHPVLAALANPARRCHRLLIGREDARALMPTIEARLGPRAGTPRPEIVTRRDLTALLGDASPHQGLCLRVDPLAPLSMEALLARPTEAETPPRAGTTVVALDQVTDPRNVGAIFRSAAAFGARAVLLSARHAPPETGVLARAASGALELVPRVEVTNLARALDRLKGDGWWTLGLAQDASEELTMMVAGERTVLVLGAEGKGLRRLTRETCDVLVRLPTDAAMPSLNVSNAAAVALFALGARSPERD
jgi:23S rRNA (guanosine2251-2'-O)-methyltransferase